MLVEPKSPGSSIINFSGDNMVFSIDIDSYIANITALNYLVEVTMSGTVANIYWYLISTGTSEYYTTWNTIGESLAGLPYLTYSVPDYEGTIEFSSLTGTNLFYDPKGYPSRSNWYPNSYYNWGDSDYKFWMGYTFSCPKTGQYNIRTENLYITIQPQTSSLQLTYNATITLKIAGEESATYKEYTGNFAKYMTEHDGLNVSNISLVSGTQYTISVDYDIEVTDFSASFLPSNYRWWITLGNVEYPGQLWYIITGSSG